MLLDKTPDSIADATDRIRKLLGWIDSEASETDDGDRDDSNDGLDFGPVDELDDPPAWTNLGRDDSSTERSGVGGIRLETFAELEYPTVRISAETDGVTRISPSPR